MSHIKLELDFRNYLHEKAQESRQNEMQAWFMFVAGALFFVGGAIISVNLGSSPEWFIFIPYHMNFDSGPLLSLSLIISGICLLISSIIIGLHYYHERMWFMRELQKAYETELGKTTPKEEIQKIRAKCPVKQNITKLKEPRR